MTDIVERLRKKEPRWGDERFDTQCVFDEYEKRMDEAAAEIERLRARTDRGAQDGALMRRPVQIAPGEGGYLYALCDDGSVWIFVGRDRTPPWQHLPDVPQAENEGKE